MKNQKKIFDLWENKALFYFMMLVSLVVVIIFFFYQKNNRNYNYLKIDKNKTLVYTKTDKSSSEFTKLVPFINIKSSVIDYVNEDIDLFLSDFINSDSVITYNYGINGIILSVVVKVMDYSEEFAPQPYFRSYNVNLKTKEVISDESLLATFGLNDDLVSSKIEDKFLTYYKNITKEKDNYEEECDYQCFLSYRNVNDYLADLSYYVKDGKLIAYKPFIFSSDFERIDFFEEKDFEFILS